MPFDPSTYATGTATEDGFNPDAFAARPKFRSLAEAKDVPPGSRFEVNGTVYLNDAEGKYSDGGFVPIGQVGQVDEAERASIDPTLRRFFLGLPGAAVGTAATGQALRATEGLRQSPLMPVRAAGTLGPLAYGAVAAMLAGAGTSKALPPELQAQVARDAEESPIQTLVGETASQLPFFRPGMGLDLMNRATSGAIGGGLSVGTQLVLEGDVSAKDALIAAASNALLNKETQLGTATLNAGARSANAITSKLGNIKAKGGGDVTVTNGIANDIALDPQPVNDLSQLAAQPDAMSQLMLAKAQSELPGAPAGAPKANEGEGLGYYDDSRKKPSIPQPLDETYSGRPERSKPKLDLSEINKPTQNYNDPLVLEALHKEIEEDAFRRGAEAAREAQKRVQEAAAAREAEARGQELKDQAAFESGVEMAKNPNQPITKPQAPKEVPVSDFVGHQDMGDGTTVELWNTPDEVKATDGTPLKSTVGRETLEKMGYKVPEAPKPISKPSEAAPIPEPTPEAQKAPETPQPAPDEPEFPLGIRNGKMMDALDRPVTYKAGKYTLGLASQGGVPLAEGGLGALIGSQIGDTEEERDINAKKGFITGVALGGLGTVRFGMKPGLLKMTAFHGTPHKVDKFSSDKIGTGEGNQVYGHGLYFAQNKGVGEGYRERLGGGRSMRNPSGENVGGFDDNGMAGFAVRNWKGDWDKTIKFYKDKAGYEYNPSAKGANESGMVLSEASASNVAELEAYRDKGYSVGPKGGNLYEVDLDIKPEEMLVWDKPLSEQSETVRSALKKAGVPDEFLNAEPGTMGDRSGEEIYRWLGKRHGNITTGGVENQARAASETLNSLGVKGIKYSDQGSRAPRPTMERTNGGQWRVRDPRLANGEPGRIEVFPDKSEAQEWFDVLNKEFESSQTHNLVTFDDSRIKILKENDRPVNPFNDGSVSMGLDPTKLPAAVRHLAGEGKRLAGAVNEGLLNRMAATEVQQGEPSAPAPTPAPQQTKAPSGRTPSKKDQQALKQVSYESDLKPIRDSVSGKELPENIAANAKKIHEEMTRAAEDRGTSPPPREYADEVAKVPEYYVPFFSDIASRVPLVTKIPGGQKLSDVVGTFAKAIKSQVGLSSDNIRDVSPRLAGKIVEMEHKEGTIMNSLVKEIKPFWKLAREVLPKDQFEALDQAALTGNREAIDAILNASPSAPKLQAALEANLAAKARGLELSREAGRDIGENDTYFHRVLHDRKGLLRALGSDRSVIDDALAKARKDKGSLSPDEEVDIINAVLEGSMRGNKGPGYLNARVIEEITPELSKFYEPAEVGDTVWAGKVARDVTNREYFGKLQPDEAEMAGYGGTFGDIIQQEKASGAIRRRGEDLVRKNMESLFTNRKKYDEDINKLASGFRKLQTFGYLADIGTAAVQFADIFSILREYGALGARKAYGRGLPKISDIGVTETHNQDVAEFSRRDEGSITKAASAPFKFAMKNLIGKADELQKSATIRAATQSLHKAFVEADSALYRQMEARYSKEFPERWQGIKEAIRSKDFVNGKWNDDASLLLFSELARLQPISKSSRAQGYNDANEFKKIFYTLRSYPLKQVGILREQAYNEMKRGNYRSGLARGFTYLTLVAVGQQLFQYAKDQVLQRDVPAEEYAAAGFLQLAMIPRYSIYRAKQTGLATAALETFVPGVGIINDLGKDALNTAKFVSETKDARGNPQIPDLGTLGENLEATKYVPGIGRELYAWFGKGKLKEQKEADRKARGLSPRPTTLQEMESYLAPPDSKR